MNDEPDSESRGEPLLNSVSRPQTNPDQNRTGFRVGLTIASVSLLVVIVTVLAWHSLSDIRIVGVIFGGGGVLTGLIFVFAYSYTGGPVDNRHEGIATMLQFIGMVAMMLALAAAIAKLSWPIAVIAGSLSAFELWALLWGSRCGSLLALRAIVQLALFATFLCAALSHTAPTH